MSPVPDPLAIAVDALSLPCEDLDAYTFPPAAILGKVVEKLQDSPCKRIILIAPGWPNMPWFGDLVAMSSQIPLSLPNLPKLLTQHWPQLWIEPSSLTGPSVRSEHCATIWTGPQTSDRIRSWFLSPLRKVSTRHLTCHYLLMDQADCDPML